MEFEIDVSGKDLLSKDYTIVVAERNNQSKNSIIFGYKFREEIIKVLRSRHGQGFYRYKLSKSHKSLFKIRLYNIAIYYIFKHIYQRNKNIREKINLYLCRDFEGRENDIKSNINTLLKEKLNLNIESILFLKLQKGSNADKYAYLMRKDKKNLMKNHYITIKIEEFENFLK